MIAMVTFGQQKSKKTEKPTDEKAGKLNFIRDM
jgi:hypothetical protein